MSNSQLLVTIRNDIKTPSYFCFPSPAIPNHSHYLIAHFLFSHQDWGNTTLPTNTFRIHFFLTSTNKLLSHANNYILQTNDESWHRSSFCTVVLIIVLTEFSGIHRHIVSTPSQVAFLAVILPDGIFLYMLCKAYCFISPLFTLYGCSAQFIHFIYLLIIKLPNNSYILWLFRCTWNMYMTRYILCFLQSHSFYFHLFSSVSVEGLFKESSK